MRQQLPSQAPGGMSLQRRAENSFFAPFPLPCYVSLYLCRLDSYRDQESHIQYAVYCFLQRSSALHHHSSADSGARLAAKGDAQGVGVLWHDELSHVGLCASRIYHSPACLAMNSLQTAVASQRLVVECFTSHCCWVWKPCLKGPDRQVHDCGDAAL